MSEQQKQPENEKTPKKPAFILFCHIPPRKEDLNSTSAEESLIAKRIDALYAEHLETILTDPEGHLVLWFDAFESEVLGNLSPADFRQVGSQELRKKRKKKLEGKHYTVTIAGKDHKKRGAWLKDLASHVSSFPKATLLTAFDLVDLLGEMSNVHELGAFLLGDRETVKYDSPKIIDAVLRLRLLGSGVPVFRLDEDVLLPPDDKNACYKLLKKAVAAQIKNVKDHGDGRNIWSTMLSVGYEDKDDEKDLNCWARFSATRPQPALSLEKGAEAVQRATEDESLWELAANTSFVPDLQQQFFEPEQMVRWGAPPTAVISGGLLYLSDAVILDVPPFSNFNLGVMYIDDHLRYALHRELTAFAKVTTMGKNGPLHVRDDDNPVVKYRTGWNAFHKYTLGTYLPQLLYGAIMDAWITAPKVRLKNGTKEVETWPLKLRRIDVKASGETTWDTLREASWRGETRGILADEINKARGGRGIHDEARLRKNLRSVAMDRITVLRDVWGDKKMRGSFAYHWIHGTVRSGACEAFGKVAGATEEEQRTLMSAWAEGMEPGSRAWGVKWTKDNKPDLRIASQLAEDIEVLITDAVNYLRWVRLWPSVVQAIRAVPRGEFGGDPEAWW